MIWRIPIKRLNAVLPANVTKSPQIGKLCVIPCLPSPAQYRYDRRTIHVPSPSQTEFMTDTLTIYKQIYPNQCSKIAALGYRSVINIRPDAESETQPKSCDLESASNQANLAYQHLPFDDEHLSRVTVEQFAAYYHDFPKPILMFCGTGARAKLLYQSALMQGLL